MAVPHLPLDVWFRIATLLDPASLSNLSLVNTSLHRIAMDRTHFLRHLQVPTSPHIPYQQLYRRITALSHPPEAVSSTHANLSMLCVVQDALLLLDFDKATLIALPSGLTFPVEHVLGSLRKSGTRVLNQLEGRVFPLPDMHVGFTFGFNSSRLSVLDLKTGDVYKHKLRRKRKPKKPIVHGKSLMVAGNYAEWLLYRVDATTAEIIDWRDGTVVRVIDNLDEHLKFIIGECPTIDDSSVVGLVYKKNNGSIKEVLAKGFDDVEMTFRVDDDKNVHSVLRSADKKTHVLITAGSPEGKPIGFIAHRKLADDEEKWWDGQFMNGMLYPELRENGRVIVMMHRPFLRQTRCTCAWRHLSSWQLWVALKDGTETWGSTESMTIRSLNGRAPPIWSRRLREGVIALMAGKVKGVIELVRFVNDGGTVTEKRLKTWTIDNLSNLCVVADHFVVATSYDRKLHLLHFDKFCNGVGGVYACPLTGLLTYCYFPDDFREREECSPSRKRRRIADGQECTK